ncbi:MULTISPECIES: MetQ/NlpA family ABC transporter substrate-binding protein [unclassified Nostoc]|uniref:MetQ/NlpA family ABC transporter substrate-binding protein n=1 Tax=unclassified Nostoc TaxID=2593658 RepID=UPI002622D441|nr:MetQ/NlpA family ABC transporter substrate-binding protein [Nostoc sp. S13]MDF5738324.1 MetQ/NlpA family ABC transporter substrate-binding protein [Nostoc sp. S13]
MIGIISKDILKFVNTKLASQEGLEVKVVTFNDWIQPNTALRNKVIDTNFFEHRPFINNAVKELKINLVRLNLVSLSTLGLFSKSLKSVNEVYHNCQ